MSRLSVRPNLDVGLLVDIHGRTIPDGELRERAALHLQEYIARHRSRFDDWFRENGPVRPPVQYDMQKEEWVWP